MANMYDPRTTGALPDPVSPMGLAASAAGQGLMQFGESFIKVTDRNAELEAEEIKRVALAEVDRMKTSFNQGMAIETMDLDKAKLEETKRGNLASEEANRIAEARLQQKTEADIAHQQGTLDIQRESLQDARDKWDEQMGLKERELKMQESRDRLAEDIAEKNWEQADKELAFQKEKFDWTQDIEMIKVDQADQSLDETKRQFDSNVDIRKQELAITEARLELDTNTAEDKIKLDERRVELQEDLKTLEERRVVVTENKAAQEKIYQDAILDLKEDEAALNERGMEIKEDMLVIAQGESERDKWVFKEVPIYEQVLTAGTAGDSTAEYDQQIVGYKIVAINVDEPELMDVREWTEDGWSNGTPDMDKEALSAISDVQKIMNNRDVSAVEAIAMAKKANPDWKGWEGFEKRIILDVVIREGQVNVGEQVTTGIITPDSGAISTEEDEAIEGILNPPARPRFRGSAAALRQ